MSEVDPAACADAYRALRARVTDLVRAAASDALDQIAPATPEWRVRDVVAHMAGVNTDIVEGRLAGVGTDPWTDAQVATRRVHTIEQLLDEWDTTGSEVEANAALLGQAAGQWLYDACTHEHDLRHALGEPGARESDAVALGFAWATGPLADGLAAANRPGFVLRTEDDITELGTAPRSSVQVSRFEMVRTMAGRRSRRQVEEYDWRDPARPDDLVLAIFHLRPDDFVE